MIAPVGLEVDLLEVEQHPCGAGLLEHREPADRVEVDADAVLPALALDLAGAHPPAMVVGIALLAVEEAEHLPLLVARAVPARPAADDAGAGLPLQPVEQVDEIIEAGDRGTVQRELGRLVVGTLAPVPPPYLGQPLAWGVQDGDLDRPNFFPRRERLQMRVENALELTRRLFPGRRRDAIHCFTKH